MVFRAKGRKSYKADRSQRLSVGDVPVTQFQIEAQRILSAQLAAERMLRRVNDAEHDAVMKMSRDEISALAQQLIVVASIAERHHLAVAQAGSLAPEVFGEPTL